MILRNDFFLFKKCILVTCFSVISKSKGDEYEYKKQNNIRKYDDEFDCGAYVYMCTVDMQEDLEDAIDEYCEMVGILSPTEV